MMDNVQKHNICINVLSSQTFRVYLCLNRLWLFLLIPYDHQDRRIIKKIILILSINILNMHSSLNFKDPQGWADAWLVPTPAPAGAHANFSL
jgi:hypothetical protein